jgi:hypothetical protein
MPGSPIKWTSARVGRARHAMQRMRARRVSNENTTHLAARRGDESGAVIILALVFLVSVSLIVIALLGWVGTSLTASAQFSDERTTEMAATSAVDLAIQNTRYTFTSAMVNASPPVQCWGSTAASAPASSLSVDGKTIDVWCSMTWTPFSQSAEIRTVTYSACPDPSTAAQCALTPLLQAVDAFDDLPVGSAIVPADHPVPCTTPPNGYCGESMTQESWQWSPDVPSVSGISVTTAPITGLNNGNPIPITITGNGFVPGATVNFVQETGANPGPGVVPTTANAPVTPSGQEEGVIVSAPVTAGSVSCSGPVNTNCSLTATVPSVTSGPYYFVTVTTPGGTSAYQTAPTGGTYVSFSYTPVPPTVTNISGTTAGAITGGTLITVNGTGFYSVANFAAQVVFCDPSAPPCTITGANPTGFLASDVEVSSSNEITALSPSVNISGCYYVEVNTVGGSSGGSAGGPNCTAPDDFNYSVQVPIIFSLSPTSGPTGTQLTINGYNFVPGSQVGWVLASNSGANPTSLSTPSTITQTQIIVNVPTLTKAVYIPVIVDPSAGYGGLESQPYLEAPDEFTHT